MRKQIEDGAKQRADFLRQRANMEHTLEDRTMEASNDELERLLKRAAKNIKKPKLNVIPYLVNLRHELYDTVESLEEESVDTLSNYMPRRLAKAVHQILHDSGTGCRVQPLVVGGTSSIYSDFSSTV